MSHDLPSSEIREILFQSEVSNVESDVSVEDFPDNENLEDFSSGSDDNYNPDLNDLLTDSSSDSEADMAPIPRPRPSQQDPDHLWVRVYPPEPEIDIAAEFEQRQPGIRNCPSRKSDPIKYLYLFCTMKIWNLMVTQTNIYAQKQIKQKRDSGEMKQFSRLQKWADVSVKEMKKFMALLINMGLIFKNNIEDYWSTSKSQSTPFFPATMSLKRFKGISSMLHLSSLPRVARGMVGYDPWFEIRTFYDNMNKSFKKYFIPHQNLAIDESLIGMKNYILEKIFWLRVKIPLPKKLF